MNRLKKVLRFLGLTLFIILASSGLGISGVIFPNHKDKQQLIPEIKTELVEEREESDDESDELE
ncbi:MAG: hypothetical protein AAFN93_20730 [Bacteroidota bacterium]